MLARRGHRLSFVHQADAAALVRLDEGLGFAAVGQGSHPPGSLAEATARMARLNGFAGLRAMIRDVAHTTDMLARELPAKLAAIGAEAVIADQMEPAGGLVAEALGLPHVTPATGLPINREPQVPPPYVPWGHHPGAFGRWLNRGGYRGSDLLMRPIAETIAANARALGLSPRRRAEDCFSSAAQLAQCVRGLDFLRAALPPGFHYLGPFREPTADVVDLP